MQRGLIKPEPTDIIANLPYADGCALWFDHHVTNQPQHPFEGLYRIAPSAARLIYEYYSDRLPHDFTELLDRTDDIDSANLTREQVLSPQKDPYLLLSMTISSRIKADAPYWNHLVQLLRATPIDKIMANPEVRRRSAEAVQQNETYEKLLQRHTTLFDRVAVSDFRSFEKSPNGNRFLVYSLFPDAIAAVKIRYAIEDPDKVILSVGHSIFNSGCRINVGRMLAGFGGGGHAGAGATTFHKSKSEDYIQRILDILIQNRDNP
jgi:oligoribonuclease NrnB/cAMP/cGMP phosphodiesterase (DHH superfamily)